VNGWHSILTSRIFSVIYKVHYYDYCVKRSGLNSDRLEIVENMERERGVEPPYQAWESNGCLSIKNKCVHGD